MATALKLRSDIKKLKKAIETKGISDSVKSKLKVQLEKAEKELSAMQKTGKAPKKSSVAGTKKTLTALEKLLQKKKFGVYKGKGVDIKKDAERPALPIGKRKSKSGNTYYEYRANRIDVRQPSKKFKIKLKDGGMMAKGGEISKYHIVPYKRLKIANSPDLVEPYYSQSFTISGSLSEANEAAQKYVRENDIFKDEIISAVVTKIHPSGKALKNKKVSYVTKDEIQKFEDGGMMAKGGSLDSKLKKYATEDVNLIQKEGGMAITDTKLGVIFGEHKVGVFTFSNRDGKTLFSGNKDEAIDFVKNNYQVEGMADGGMMEKGGYVAVSENDGYWYIISTPTTKEKAQQIIDMGVPKGEVGKVVTLAEAKAHKKVIGEEYLEGGGMMAKGGVSFGKFGSGRINKNAWIAANYIGDSKVELGELQSYLERNTNEKFDKDKIYTITRTLYETNDYQIDDNKDWKLSKIYRKRKMADGGMMAKGGLIQHGLEYGDKIISSSGGNVIEVESKSGDRFLINLDKGKRLNKKEYTMDSATTTYKDFFMEKGGMMAKGGKLSDNFSSEIQEGDIVWDSGNKRYGVVLNTYDFKYGEIRLDSDGNQPLENLHKLGSEGDKGTKDKLVAALVAHKRLMVEYPDRYEKVNYADGGMMARGGKLSLEEFREKYDENEDNNLHSENVVLLAENFGTADDIRDAKTILAKHEAMGSLPSYLMKERYELSDKLWKKYLESRKLKSMARGGYNTGRSWHLDRARHNQAESWERPLNQRKKEDGGIISTIHRNSN